MGITKADLDAQRAMLARGEEKRKADWKQAERERLRDTLAAAALTGLLSNIPRYQLGVIAVQAYDIADEMLRERVRRSAPTTQPAPPCVETDKFSPGSRTGPINRTPERESPRRECGESSPRDVSRPDTKGKAAGGPGPSFTSGGVDRPVSYLKNDEKRVFYDVKRDTTQPRGGALSGVPDPDSRVWETPCTPQTHATPPLGDPEIAVEMLKDRVAELEHAFDLIARADGAMSVVGGNVVVTVDATLTAEEREAIEWAIYEGPLRSQAEGAEERAVTLRKLLERLHT